MEFKKGTLLGIMALILLALMGNCFSPMVEDAQIRDPFNSFPEPFGFRSTRITEEETYYFNETYSIQNTYNVIDKWKILTTPNSWWFKVGVKLILPGYNRKHPNNQIISPLHANDIYFGVDLIFESKITYNCNYTLRTTIEGDGLSKTVSTELTHSSETYYVEMKPYFDIYLERYNNGTKNLIQRHSLAKLPLPVLENIDEGDDKIKLGDIDIYFWNEYVQVGEVQNFNNHVGSIVYNNDRIVLAEFPVLEIIGAAISKCSYIFPAAKLIGDFIEFIGKYIIQVKFIIAMDVTQCIQNFILVIADTLPSNQIHQKYLSSERIVSEPGLGFNDGNINDSFMCNSGNIQIVHGNGTNDVISFTPLLFWNVESNISFGGYIRIEPADNRISKMIWSFFVDTDYIDIPVIQGIGKNVARSHKWTPVRTGWHTNKVTFQGVANTPPLANFNVNDLTPARYQTVVFDCSDSSDPDGNSLTYQMVFGDGNTSGWDKYSSITHKYNREGTFNAILHVSDGSIEVASPPVLITVTDLYPYNPPNVVLTATPSDKVAPNTPITFNVSGSSVFNFTDATIYYYFGDNTSLTTSSQTVAHNYTDAGRYFVEVIIVDERGGYGVRTTDVTVVNSTQEYVPQSVLLVIDDEGDQTISPDNSSTTISKIISNESIPIISKIDTYLVGDIDDDGYLDVAGSDGPNTTVLNRYELVIWVTGSAWNNTLTPTDQNEIRPYVSNGGKLWLIGSEIFFDLGIDDPGSGDFAYDVLGIDYITQDVGLPSSMYGSEYGDVYEGFQFESDSIDPDYSDIVENATFAMREFLNVSDPSKCYAVTNSDGPGMTLTYSFELSAINQSDRYELFMRTIAWFFNYAPDHDSFENAKLIHSGLFAVRNITEGESIYYKIECPEGSNINISILQWEIAHDYDLHLFDNNQNLVDSDTSLDSYFFISYDIPFTGTHTTIVYFNITSVSGSGYFEISVNVSDLNDNITYAEELTWNDGIAEATGSLGQRYDRVDWFVIEANNGESFAVTLYFPDDTPMDESDVDFDLYVYDDNAYLLNCSIWNDPMEEVGIVANYTGLYYIQIYSYEGIGSYYLIVEQVTYFSDITDSPENPLELMITGSNAYYSFYLDQAFNPKDYFMIWASDFETLTFKVMDPSYFGEPTNEYIDYDIYIYYNDGLPVDFNNDDLMIAMAATYESNETITIETNQTGQGYYYIKIEAFCGRGNYSLQILDDNDKQQDSIEIPYPDFGFWSSLYYDGNYEFDQYDWYKMYMYEGEILQIELYGEQETADFDIEVYYGDLFVNGSYSALNYEFLNVTIDETGYYYINVSSYSGYGYYYLWLNLNEEPYIISEKTNFTIEDSQLLLISLEVWEFDGDPISVQLTDAPEGLFYDVTDSGDGTYEIDMSWTPTYPQAGYYIVTVHVLDAFHDSQVDIGINVIDTDIFKPIYSWNFKPTIGTTGESVEVNLTVVDDTGVVSHNISINSQEYVMESNVNYYTYTILIPTNNVSSILYSCKFEDTEGNFNYTETVTLTVLDNDPPIADAGDDVDVGPGTDVVLNATESWDNIGIVNYKWSFTEADNSVSLNGTVVSYPFSYVAHHLVTLNISDAGGNWATDTVWVNITDNERPIADAGDDIIGVIGDTIVFNGSISTDNYEVVSYLWSFEYNGTMVELTGQSTSYVFHVPGTYTVMLIVQDIAGLNATDTIHVTIHPKYHNITINLAYGDGTAIDGVVMTVTSDGYTAQVTVFKGNATLLDIPAGDYKATMTVDDISYEFNISVAIDGTVIYTIPNIPPLETEKEVKPEEEGSLITLKILLSLIILVVIVVVFVLVMVMRSKKGKKEELTKEPMGEINPPTAAPPVEMEKDTKDEVMSEIKEPMPEMDGSIPSVPAPPAPPPSLDIGMRQTERNSEHEFVVEDEFDDDLLDDEFDDGFDDDLLDDEFDDEFDDDLLDDEFDDEFDDDLLDDEFDYDEEEDDWN